MSHQKEDGEPWERFSESSPNSLAGVVFRNWVLSRATHPSTVPAGWPLNLSQAPVLLTTTPLERNDRVVTELHFMQSWCALIGSGGHVTLTWRFISIQNGPKLDVLAGNIVYLSSYNKRPYWNNWLEDIQFTDMFYFPVPEIEIHPETWRYLKYGENSEK